MLINALSLIYCVIVLEMAILSTLGTVLHFNTLFLINNSTGFLSLIKYSSQLPPDFVFRIYHPAILATLALQSVLM